MSLLARHLQVHPGLVHAVIELLAVADRPLSPAEVVTYLQPDSFKQQIGHEPPDVVNLTLEATEWLGLVRSIGTRWELTDAVVEIGLDTLDSSLPRLVRRGLFGRSWPDDVGEASTDAGDLGLALSWYLAQDAWAPPRRFERLGGPIEELLRTQFDPAREYINLTKWPVVRRWLHYCGLGVPDPLDGDMSIPDPTAAVQDELTDLDGNEWPAMALVRLLGERCGALDTGGARRVAMSTLKGDELAWEHDHHTLSPSLSLALVRLESDGTLELARQADAEEENRCSLTLPDQGRLVDWVRLLKVAA